MIELQNVYPIDVYTLPKFQFNVIMPLLTLKLDILLHNQHVISVCVLNQETKSIISCQRVVLEVWKGGAKIHLLKEWQYCYPEICE
jgi:hypothetical protein